MRFEAAKLIAGEALRWTRRKLKRAYCVVVHYFMQGAGRRYAASRKYYCMECGEKFENA